MSQTLNKSSNQVARESSGNTISSSFGSSTGGHSIIPVLLPSRNVAGNSASIVQCPSQTFLLSDAVSITNQNSTDPSHVKPPQLAVRVVSNTTLNSANKLTKNIVGTANHIVNGTTNSIQQPHPIAMKTSVSSINSQLQAPQILPKIRNTVSKVKTNTHPNMSTGNNPVSIFPPVINQTNVPSRLIVHQKIANTPSSTSTVGPQVLEQNYESEGKSGQILPCVSSSTSSIPIINSNTRQVNLMMLSNTGSGQTISNSPISNTLVIGSTVQSSSSITSASSTANVVQINQKNPLLVNNNKNVTTGSNFHQGITINNVFVAPNQTNNNSGILIKQQQTGYQPAVTPISTPATVSSTINQQQNLDISAVENTRPISLPMMVASTANRPQTIEPSSVSTGAIRSVPVNHPLGGTFIATTNQLHQTISTPSPHVNIIPQNNPQAQFSSNSGAANSYNNKRRSRKQILQTGANQAKASNHSGQLHHAQVLGNVDSNNPPGPTTALLITTSSASSGGSLTSSNLGSNSSTTCSSINLNSSTITSTVGNGNNSIFGLRLVPVKPQQNISTNNSQSGTNPSTTIGTIRLATNNNSLSNHILIPSSSASPSVSCLNQSNSCENASDQVPPIVSSSSLDISTSPKSNVMKTSLDSNTPSNIKQNLETLKKNSGSPYSEHEHEIAKSLVSTCHELKKTNHNLNMDQIEEEDQIIENDDESNDEDEDHDDLFVNPELKKIKPPQISQSESNVSAKAHHFQSKTDFKMKSIEASFANSYLSLLYPNLLDKDSNYHASTRKRAFSSLGNNKRGSNSNSDPDSQTYFKRELFLLWNTLLDLRIKQSKTQFVKYPIATTSTLDVTGWRLLQSTNNLEFLKNSEFHACTSLHNIESMICNYITNKKLSFENNNNSTKVSILNNNQENSINEKTKVDSKIPSSPLENVSCENNIEGADDLYLAINPKRPRALNGKKSELNKNNDLILKLDKTLDLIKGLQQRQKILWDRMSGLIDMTNGLMDNHRYPALQIFDDLSLLLSHANRNRHHHHHQRSSLNNIEPVTDSDEANQSDESIVNV